MLRIAHLGTFDVNNYGDLLFPMILRTALEARLKAFELAFYSPKASAFTVDRSYRCLPIAKLRSQTDVDAIVIGGGQLLASDSGGLLNVYRLVVPFSSLPSHLTTIVKKCYRVWDHIRGFNALSDNERWRATFGYECVAPFIFERETIPPQCRVIYNAIGVYDLNGFMPSEQCQRVRAAFEEADYISVRDRYSEKALRDIGVQGDIAVVPDTALLLTRCLDAGELRKTAQLAFVRAGLDPSRRLLCVQATAPQIHQQSFADAIAKFADEHSIQVALLPTRSWAEDARRLAEFARYYPRRFRLLGKRPSPATIAAVIAHSTYVVTSGLHSLVTAVAFGKPCCAVPSQDIKIAGFLEEVGLSDIMATAWETVPNRIQELGELSERRVREVAEAGRERVNHHFDTIGRILSS